MSLPGGGAWSVDGALPRRPVVTAFVVLAVLMCVKAFYNIMQGGPAIGDRGPTDANSRGNLVYVALWAGLYLASASIVAVQVWRRGIPLRMAALLGAMLYVMASAGWSENWIGSLPPATMLFMDVLVAAALATTVHPLRFLRMVAAVNVLLIVVSLALVVALPSLSISDPTRPGLLMSGEMLGAYDTKGTLGLSASISIVILLFAPFPPGTRRYRWLAASILGLGLVLANSAGSFVASGIAIATVMTARRFPAARTPIVVGVTAVAVAWSILLPFVDAGSIAQLIGRTANLTGRGTFWPMAPGFIADRPWFGYGYEAFFRPEPYARGWDVWNREQWFFTPEFHNAFLDILIGLGAVGAAAYLAIVGGAASVALNDSLEPRCRLVMSAILIVYLIGSATEFSLLSHNSFGTLFLFYCCLVAGRTYGPAIAEARPRDGWRPFPAV